MNKTLETTMDLLKETVHLRVEYDYQDDDNISIWNAEIFRSARECALYWSWETWVRVELTNILSYAQIDAIKAQIIEHESTIRQWNQECA